MSGLGDWINKRPQLKRPDFWLGISLMFVGSVWFALTHQNFLLRSIGLVIALGGMFVMLNARRLK